MIPIKVLNVQRMDNKIINFISTIGLYGTTEMKRTVGPEKVIMNSEIVLKSSTANLGGVDQMDQ